MLGLGSCAKILCKLGQFTLDLVLSPIKRVQLYYLEFPQCIKTVFEIRMLSMFQLTV